MTEEKKPVALVVEDDENLANAFGYALDAFDVKVIYDGAEAVQWLQEGHIPAVVVLDLNLPGVPGSEILDFIRSKESLNATHVFLATANDQLAESLRSKADLVLLKPIGFKQLQELANRFTLRKRDL